MTTNKTVFMIIIFVYLMMPVIISQSFAQQPKKKKHQSIDSSLVDIKEKGTLIVGVDIPYGVMEFYDSSGKPIGIDIDIAHEIASRLDVSMSVKTMPFSKLFDALKSKEVDILISAVTITPERQKEMLFSVPYLNAGMSIAVRTDDRTIQSLEDLKGKKVGVLKGTVGEDLASKSGYITPSLVTSYQKNDERIKALLEGELDVIIVHFLTKEHSSLKIVGEPLSESYYGIVARLNNHLLMNEINTILRDMKRKGELRAITRKYISTN